MEKRLPVGVSDFKEMIEDDYYYVDKSLFIKELIDNPAKVALIPRPRRFGKTLNLSMVQYFFERSGEDNSHLFTGLKIMEADDKYLAKQGKQPVISLTFKDIKHSKWDKCLKDMMKLIAEEYSRHDYLLASEVLNDYQRRVYREIISLEADDIFYQSALKDLSQYLREYYQERVMILIDEYDAPIQTGYLNGYYNQVVDFMRNLLSGGLKDNPHLEKGILTGILRVAKESIFSGLNNLSVYTLLDKQFAHSFGLLEEEVKQLLADYQLSGCLDEVKNWYNGYSFGNQVIYNPWSIIKYVENNGLADPYWANTSSNDLIKQTILAGGSQLKTDLQSLIEGEPIKVEIDKNIVFPDIETSSHAVWSFLLFSGYLRANSQQREEARLYCQLEIPNIEIKYIYENIILSWFEQNITNHELNLMLNSLTQGDLDTFSVIFQEFVLNSMSNFDIGGDEPEKVYHVFVLGLLLNLRDDYQVISNRESGYGRYDVMIIPEDKSELGIVMEFKKANNYKDESLEAAVEAALEQIKNKNYKQELINKGVEDILELGIAFSGKKIMVESS